MSLPGLFISFEGPDGSGKSSVLKRLQKEIFDYFTIEKKLCQKKDNKPIEFIFKREPGGTPIGDKIRDLLLSVKSDMLSITEAFLFAASRAELFHGEGLEHLKNGNVLICDRYVDSSIAYQGAGRQLGEKLVSDINSFATQGIKPDYIFFLMVKPYEGLNRIKKNRDNPDRLDQLEIDFHQRVYDSYTTMINKHKKRAIVIDASQSEEKVYSDVFVKMKEVITKHYK
ncbi:dTMP kinase [[Mycoplasma] testudinis]|uniref:dTMP kinase n=1 Tax=[Mycoplasma] testudinis TaxID=33924 RepID=UPI000482BFA0|nr:dTMP kinase [[Mycoplasma] testudinis]